MTERAEQGGRRSARAIRPVGSPVPPTETGGRAVEVSAPLPGRNKGATTLTTYAEALAYLYDHVNVEKSRPGSINPDVWKLDRMRALMTALGEPQQAFKSVHVAGSKGKGSTSMMLAACLQGCGYTTGLYTSPHLVDVRERIQIDGNDITEADFAAAMRKVAAAAGQIRKKWDRPTFFEVITALAFVHFAEQAIDVAVIEVGLGGRLDSTNVITPEVTAVTSIQLEHTQILGDTLAKIAREKAGIFKKGVPALTVPQSSPEVLQTFREVAGEVGCGLQVVGEDIEFSWRMEATGDQGPRVLVSLATSGSNFEHLVVPLKGEHQAHNCGLALAVLDKLRSRGFDTPERKVAQGLARTPTTGRMELVWERPRILVDGAHNPESVGGLMKALGAHLRYDSLIVIFGCAADKNVRGMLERLATAADKIIFTKAEGNARAMEPRELQKRFGEVSGKMTQTAVSVKDALNAAHKAVGKGDLICVTGSFYVAGEAKRLLQDKARR